MAGSLNHIVDDDGTFRMDLIENMRDAREALEECHQVIAILLESVSGEYGASPVAVLSNTCLNLGFPVPVDRRGCAVSPTLQPELHGVESIYRECK